MSLDPQNIDDEEIKKQIEKNKKRLETSIIWRMVFTFYAFVFYVLSFVLGIPLRLYWYWLLRDRRADMKGIRPYWSLMWALQSWVWPRPVSDGVNEILADVHMGCLIGRCATGQLHYYGWEMSTQVMRWNRKNGRPMLNFAKKGAEGALDALITQMDKCGYRPRKAPLLKLKEMWQMR